jgi:cathepsin B
MKIAVAVLAIAALAVAVREKNAPLLDESEPIINDKLISYINGLKTTWTASADQGNFMKGMTVKQARKLMGVLPPKPGMPTLPRITYAGQNIQVPEEFDSRTNWPDCWTMQQIRDQSACGSCWAFGAVEAISDRYCSFKVNTNLSVSAQDMNSCCDSCGDGCDGGYPASAWAYWKNTGLVSEKCDPYSLPSCDHHMPNSTNPCPSNEYPTPPCVKKCQDGETWSNARHFGSDINSASGEADIQAEIFKNGPVETAFTVYADFLTYKSGVYVQHSNQVLGGHAVKFLGWGIDNTTSQKYWLVANSWNPHWGDQGYFKILRGVDECGIEEEVNFGTPKS